MYNVEDSGSGSIVGKKKALLGKIMKFECLTYIFKNVFTLMYMYEWRSII